MRKLTATDFLMNVYEDLPEWPHGFGGRPVRYNGGWMKEITSVDKSKSNGYSLVGEFLENGAEGAVRVTVGKLYLDCDIGGSRKNQEKRYRLFHVHSGKVVVICTQEDVSTWAIELWEHIEGFFNTLKNKSDIPCDLGKFTTNDLLHELSLRGYKESEK